MGEESRSDGIIIGGGFSGIAASVALARSGFADHVILEKGRTLGGTWRDNTYPGCACDVPSHLYSLSFAPKRDWSRTFAPQPEIQSYLLEVARQHGVQPRVQLDTHVERLTWEESARRWRIETSRGTRHARFVISGTGGLHTPSIPPIPGLEDFAGKVFHTARWDHDVQLSEARVAVVGTGSSAIQVVPAIQPEVGHLTLFQRTPGWVAPRPDIPYAPWLRSLFQHVPGLSLLVRNTWYALLELLQWHQRRPHRMARLEWILRGHLERQVADPVLRARLLPVFAAGCKRLLLSNSYYPALQQDNVTVTGAAQRFEPGGLVDEHGRLHEVDVVIFATGFEVRSPPIAQRVIGRHGQSLAESWSGSPRAYLGTMVAGFPNFFLMLGPNTGNGHTSVLMAAEAQASWVVRVLSMLRHRDLSALDVLPGAQRAWNDELEEALEPTVWNHGGCSSWYLDAKGRNRVIYPWSTGDLCRKLSVVKRSDFWYMHHPRGPQAGTVG